LSSFTYPGKDRLAPRLRRFVGGMLIAGSLVATFLLVKPLLDPKTFDALLFLTPLSMRPGLPCSAACSCLRA